MQCWHEADYSGTKQNRVRNQVDNELNDATKRELVSAEVILAACQVKRAFQSDFESGADAAPASTGPTRDSSRLSGGSSFPLESVPRVAPACLEHTPRKLDSCILVSISVMLLTSMQSLNRLPALPAANLCQRPRGRHILKEEHQVCF